MNESEYAVTLTPDDNNTWLATCGALPEVTTYGATREEALRNAAPAIEEALAARMADGRKIPLPDREPCVFLVRVPHLSSILTRPIDTL